MPTETQPTTAPKRKRTVIKSGQFFKTKAEITSKCVTIRLPLSVAKYLELENGKEVYFSPINGVVQLSGNVPNISIPVLNVSTSGFIPHS